VILDVGCGSGIHLNYLSKKYPAVKELVGIDLSKEMIAIAESSSSGKSSAKYFVSGMDNLPFADDYFDLAFSFNSIHYSANLNVTLAEVKRVTKRGGFFTFQVVHPVFTLFVKKSKDYSKKENVGFPIQGGTLLVSHPSFTLDEHINAIVDNDWNLVSMKELYGRRSRIGEYFIPTLICFRLQK